ncbi:MAG: tyrosine-type recombinase/integrase [Bacteroidetes bacterium]|nr:tyrosine-type recombinase/integrase [Bacteroidota bacterium]
MPTLSAILDEYLTLHNDRLRSVTKVQYRLFINSCFPEWLDRELADITRDECIVRYQELCQKTSKRAKSGGKGQADNGFRVLCALIEYSTAMHNVPVLNPVKQMRKILRPNRLKNREGHIPAHLIPAWTEEVLKLHPTIRDINIFWALTGCRLTETSEMLWDWVDWRNRMIIIPGDFTKNHRPHKVHLNGYLMLMLQTRQYFFGTSPYIFGSIQDPFMPFNKNCKPYLKIEAKLGPEAEANPHAVRHTFATTARTAGLSEEEVAVLINHKSTTVTSGYIHQPFDQIRPLWETAQNAMMQRLGLRTEKRRYFMPAEKVS